MALYVITNGDGDENSIVVNGIDALKEKLKELHECMSYSYEDGEQPYIYKLEKKMTCSIKTVVELKGE